MTNGRVAVLPISASARRHFRGVKRRLLWVLIAYGLGASLTWYFYPHLLAFLLRPAGDLLSATGRPIFTRPTDMFTLKVGMAMKGGLVIALPILVYHIARFVSPVLSWQQRRYVIILLPAALLAYMAGAAFAYYVLIPVSMKFLLSFGAGIADPMIHIAEYINLVLALLLWLGVVFELPIVMFLLAKLRLVSHRRFNHMRRYSIPAAFILGALITPTIDMVTQTMVAVPLILLYELGILLAWLARPKGKHGN